MRRLETEIAVLERVVKERIKLRPAYRYLLTVNGIGQTLALTIMLESGDIRRFAKVENSLLTAGVWEVRSYPAANAKRGATQKTETSHRPGPWWTREIL